MKLLLTGWALALAACSTAPAKHETVKLLSNEPARPYEEIARMEARGDGALREKARRLGADAVIKLGERAVTDATPAPYDPPQRPLLGNAYPGPLSVFEPGAFPPEGADLRMRGRYYIVEGVAIRYLD